MENLYEVLGVPETSSQDEIKKGYRQQAMRWHPDRNPGKKEEADERFKLIGYAYKVLSDTARRAEYDAELAEMRRAGAQSRASSQEDTSNGASQESRGRGFTEEDASTLFFEQMLDLAIELASRGYAEKLIVKALIGLDCPNAVAMSVARIAVDRFQAKASGGGGTQRDSSNNNGHDESQFQPHSSYGSGAKKSPEESTISRGQQQSDKASQWVELEPYFRAALVGPDFDASGLTRIGFLKFLRAVVFCVSIALIGSFLLDTITDYSDRDSRLGTYVISIIMGWGVAYAVLRLSRANRTLALKERLDFYLPRFQSFFMGQRKFESPPVAALIPAIWFGFNGVILPLAGFVFVIFLLDAGQLIGFSEASFTNESRLNLWRISNNQGVLIGAWIGLATLLPRFLYKKIHGSVLRVVQQEPANVHAAMNQIYSECQPRAWRAALVMIAVLIVLATPKMLFENESNWIGVAVVAEKLAPEALYEEARKIIQSNKQTPDNTARVYVYLVMAANKGQVDAESMLGNLYGSNNGWLGQDAARMHYWLTRAAEHGSLWAMAYLGNHYYQGTNGLPKDEVKAVNYWRQAASQGYPSALVSMGWAHMTGIGGVPIDFNQAFVLNSKGAEGGNREGYNNLGWLYENGKGINKNLSLALVNYKKAAELGSVEAKERYEKLAQYLSEQQSDATPEQRRFDLVVAELERMFPPLNPASPQYNQRVTDRVLSRQRELVAQGYSPSVALRNAGYEVARQLGLM